MTAACINVHINSETPTLLAIDTDFSSIISEYPSMTAEQLSVLTLLSSVFNIRTNLYWGKNIPWTPLTESHGLTVGELVDSTVDSSHPENSLTIYTYTVDTLKNTLKQEYPHNYSGTEEEWRALIDNTSYDDLPEVLETYFPSSFVFGKGPLKVSFSSPTAEEIHTYATNKGGIVPNYSDAYPWLKSFVGSAAQGYSRPNSTPASVTTLNGREVISFEAQVFIRVNLQDPGPPPGGSGLEPEGGYPKTYINIDLPSIAFVDPTPL